VSRRRQGAVGKRGQQRRRPGIRGAFGTKPDGSPIELTGTAISAVRDDGMLLSNQVERNAFEVYKRLTARAGVTQTEPKLSGRQYGASRWHAELRTPCHEQDHRQP
jgi:hypothetical protein